MAADSLEKYLSSLTGLECCSAHWGKGTGSVIDIGFGPMRKRDKPVSNPWLSERDRHFKADISMMIWCAWRIRRSHDVLVAWRDAGLESEAVYRSVNAILDKKVINVIFDRESGDIQFNLADDYRIDIFCDVTNEEEGDENYVFCTPHANFIVGLEGEVTRENKETRQ